MARKYTPEFKADAIRYFEDHPDMDITRRQNISVSHIIPYTAG